MSRPHRLGRLAGPLVILAGSAAAALAQSSNVIHTGTLAPGDSTWEGNTNPLFPSPPARRNYDEYQIEGQDGEEIVVVLTSLDFDPYLILIPPSGEEQQQETDDFGGSSDVSLIETTVDEPGTWTIWVTSYEAGETGEYVLVFGTREADEENAGDEEPETFTVRDTITLGATVEGTLNAEDPVRFDDSYYEAYALEASAGTNVVITLESKDFDPYLVIVSPSGELESNDDVAEGNLNSRIETTLEEPGRWLIVANTLEPEETGVYTLSVTRR
jgi:hypothetical protein